MLTINCTHPCVYENEGICTLTHVTSVSEPNNKNCAYFKKKGDASKKSNKF
ncbi:hypothetical protein SAMN05660297_00919 [Natronincola peptidivorans]|uniref:DUF1540 domain-containing protein n=1 Tax=Natronincola peptidivorans TaxID=426128 RepID=A0A1I0A7V4_9FIRM|nr:hydroxymyristoyl-ACP dehydratase [Natronincola peptidivorans]SES90242.1 hypothetical protein SAMN05660297_00919 [Natronincola peptidivorans]